MSAPRQRPGTVTDLRTRKDYQPDYAVLARNRVMMARAHAGLSPGEFAAMLSSLVGRPLTAGHVTSWETDITPPGDVLVAAMAVSPPSTSRLGVRSHKFIAAHVGPEAARRLARAAASGPGAGECRVREVEHRSGPCDLYVWPFGSAIIHLVEDLELPDIASLALWRFHSYEEDLAWAAASLRQRTGDAAASASYVLSAYWVHSPIWAGRILDSALRIICAPRVLLDRELRDAEASQSSAEHAERDLLAEGFSPATMRSFGLRGVSAGYASWSGVVYHPADSDRALTEQELIDFELGVQSIWVYCEYVNSQIEQGAEPVIGDGFGHAFLRAARSRLINPRSQETGQHRAMRDAIIQTSGLPSHLTLAIEALKELGRK